MGNDVRHYYWFQNCLYRFKAVDVNPVARAAMGQNYRQQQDAYKVQDVSLNFRAKAAFNPSAITIVKHGWFSKERWVKLPNFNQVRYYGDKQGDQENLAATLRKRLEEFRNPSDYTPPSPVKAPSPIGVVYHDVKNAISPKLVESPAPTPPAPS